MKRLLICALCLALIACCAALGEAAEGAEERFVGVWTAEGAEVEIWRDGENLRCRAVLQWENGEREQWEYDACWYSEAEDALQCGGVSRAKEVWDAGAEAWTRTDDWAMDDMNAARFEFAGTGDALVWTDDGLQGPVALTLAAAPGEVALEQLGADIANPVAPYEGEWVADRATLWIEELDDVIYCTVFWADSAFDTVVWEYEAMYDEVAGELNTLENGVKTLITYGEDGEVASNAVEYSDGAASFALAEDDRLVWTDYKGTPGENEVVFERAPDLEPEFDIDSLQIAESPEWVTNLPQAQDASVRQLFVVAGMGMDLTTATVSMHERDEDGNWMQLLSTPGFVGKNGLCLDADHAEGCGQTPIGVYRFNKAFGIAEDPGCALDYIQVDDDTYWSGDPNYHYNEMMDIDDYPELAMDDSEHIVDYTYQYQYCLNISFNEEGTPGRGSAIFLHCFGPTKPYTGGCVAIPQNIMELVMRNVTEDCVVVIDTVENLGVTF